MNINEIINTNKLGAARTTEYTLMTAGVERAYSELMTIFLRQGMIFESAVITIIGNDLIITLNGTNGQMMYFRQNSFFNSTDKIRPPISGDFAIVSTRDVHNLENTLPSDLTTLVRNRVGDNCSSLAREARISQQGRSRYNQGIVIDNHRSHGDNISIGISSFAIPVKANPTKSTNKVRIAAISQEAESEAMSNVLTEGDVELPLTLYAQRVGAANWRGYSSLEIALICNHNQGIVYDLENPYDFANLSILCSMDDGQLKRALSKSTKKRPFGLLEIHYDKEKEDASLKVRNLKDGEYEEAKVRPVDKSLDVVYIDELASKGATSIHYGTIFDIALSSRNGNTSLARVKQFLTEHDPLLDDSSTDLIGVTKDGNVVIGFESNQFTVLCTASVLPRRIDLDESLLSDKSSRSSSEEEPTAQTSTDEVVAVEEETSFPSNNISYEVNDFYRKWKNYSDDWHKARGRSPPSDLGTVFMTYMNSGSMGQEDIDEYNRLLGEEE